MLRPAIHPGEILADEAARAMAGQRAGGVAKPATGV